MANGDDKNKSSSDGKLRDSDLIAWLIGFLFFALLIGGIFRAIESRFGIFGGDGPDFGIGALVSADGDIDVHDSPAGDILGMQEDGAVGKITEGPEEADGNTWWFVDFEKNPDGWVSEKSLRLESAPLSIGDLIEMAKDSDIWDLAGGGLSNGLQYLGSIGKLIDGPSIFNGERWWKVDFDNDPDGWVRESDIKRARAGFVRLWESIMEKILIPSIILSALLIIAIAVLSVNIGRVLRELKEKYKTPETSSFVESKEERSEGNERWRRVEELSFSAEPANWRLAILEADIMLSDIVSRMGYSGGTLGEKLKQVEKSDFVTIDKAWEAHKVRNTIAHEGGDFILTQREARRVIGLYRDVFNEFHFI